MGPGLFLPVAALLVNIAKLYPLNWPSRQCATALDMPHFLYLTLFKWVDVFNFAIEETAD